MITVQIRCLLLLWIILLDVYKRQVLDSVNVTKPMASKSSPLDNNQYASVMSEELLMYGSRCV